ncbi:hypothetical protein LWI29_002843 [Acer saccharum]|uniref:CCHC-type domain-containing protein n=1 Tax=Acer saccharum TaxID=4024 RepID=A0AA39W1T9_ACESA|nr:hypothetical protein LWI29_002843 [Acer saccharum]
MNRVRIVISYNGRWEQLLDGSQRFVGSDNRGMYVSKNLTYDELVSIVHTIVNYDVSKYNVDLSSISMVPGSTCRTFISNDDDVQFMLGEDRVIPQVCVSLIERTAGDVLGNDIPPLENTLQFGSFSGSNQAFTQRSGNEGGTNMFGVPQVVVDHSDAAETQFGDVFGCRIEQYDAQYNEQNNDNYPNHEVDNEANNEHVDDLQNADEEHAHKQTHGRRVEGISGTAPPDMPGTSEVRYNVTTSDSVNATTWVIPGANSYSFDTGRSSTLEAQEPRTMIYKGQFFPSKKDLKRLVDDFAMRKNFEWKVKRSNKTTLHLVCIIDDCTWKLRVVRREEGTYFQVRSFVNEHTCPLVEIHRRHRQASAVTIAEVVAPRLQQADGRLMRPKDIIADMKTMYGIQIMYSKAHDALQYALSLTYGTHEESFQLLPSFAYVLEQQNPGTITDLQCTDDGKFLYFFMSLGSSIRGFRRCMRPVIAVDGTHLKGRFEGTMFVATAQDGNEQVYPIAFGYDDSENNLSWEWFLECLRGALGHIDDLVFISDRHASIEAGISKVFPYATHTICCWHFGENMKKRFHRKDVADIMDNAARSYCEIQYDRHMEELRRLHKGAYDYAIDAGPHKWSRVHCPQRRYRLMTTNVAECINSCLKFARQLPLMTLAEFIRNMLQKWFHDRHTNARSMRHRLTDAAHLVILKRVEKYSYMTVNAVDWNIFSVRHKGKQWTVDLARKTCTCNKFQMDFLPCSHALAAARYMTPSIYCFIVPKRESNCVHCCRERNVDFTSLCADYYKRETLIDAYSVPIMPVGHPSSWVVPSDITSRVVLNPRAKRQSGRPMEGRHVSSSERITTQSCRRCGQPGHNSRKCSNPPMVNEGPSTIVPEQYRRKCSICHSTGHNKQTCPQKDSIVE